MGSPMRPRAQSMKVGGSSGRSKPRASQACMNCRQRKVKCIGLAQDRACDSCAALQVQCVLSQDGDGRRTGSREQVVALQDRLQRLEAVIAEQRRADRSNLGEDTIVLADPSDAAEPPTPHRLSHSDHSPVDNRTAQTQPLSRSTTAHLSSMTPPPGTVGAFEHLTPASEQDRGLDVDEADGQPRYYGPTSQLYVKERDALPTDDSSGNTHQVDGLKMNALPLRNFLLDIFFRAQPLSTAVVSQASFEADRRIGVRSRLYSTFLEHAILACAARMSTSAELRRLGPQYADSAKHEIAEELGKPTISSLQAFLLLSDFEATRGRERLGYMYCGIACRLVFDLGLTESCTSLIAKGELSESEAQDRHTLLLAAHVFDKLWSMYLGRPSAIPTVMVARAHRRMISRGWHGPATLEPWVGLCMEMSEGSDTLITSSLKDQTTITRLMELDDRIRERQENLPADLALDLNRITELSPNTYGLHIQFTGARIVLNGLILRAISVPGADNPQSLERGSPRYPDATISSKRIMCNNAVIIARLVSTYQQIYGTENMVTIMLDNMYVSAGVMISYVLHWQNEHLQIPAIADLYWLQALAKLFLMAQDHYPVTERMRITLARLVSRTSLAGIFDPPQAGSPRRGPHNPIDQRTPPSNTAMTDIQMDNPTDAFKPSFDGNILPAEMFGQVNEMESGNNIIDWLLPGMDMERDDDLSL